MSAAKVRKSSNDNVKKDKSVEITLCLGVFVLVLLKCCRTGVGQRKLVLALLSTIAPDNYREDEDRDTDWDKFASKITNCKVNLPVSGNAKANIVDLARNMKVDDVAARFDAVINLLDNDKRRCLIGVLYKIISDDKYLADKHQAFFSQCMGGSIDDVINAHRLNLTRFLAGILLYTVIINDNKHGTNVITKVKKWDIEAEYSDFDIVFKQSSKSKINPENPDFKYPEGLANYLKRLASAYDYIPTLLNNKEPFRPFRAYYVPNDIVMRIRETNTANLRDGRHQNTLRNIRIQNVTLENILEASHCVVFRGDGGLGKSMMMRNLLLSCLDEYERLGLIPFFITIKDYNSEYKSILEYVCDMIHSMWPEATAENVELILKNGIALLLFDGLDEISQETLIDFTKKLNNFMTEYSENHFIISSRPYSSFYSMHNFSLVYLQKFRKEQSLELIDRYGYFASTPKIQKKFRDLVDTKLFITHEDFSNNPLLLSIMMMTFRRDAEIPTEKYRFYERAYSVLSSEHDASKEFYTRRLSTGLSAEQFAACFAYFCAVTYSESKLTFTELEIKHYLDRFKDQVTAEMIKDVRVNDIENLTVKNFIYDAANNLCLLRHDEVNYDFIHRSFQDYFCARYFHSLVDEDLELLIRVFDTNDVMKKDELTLSMLFDMKPSATEKYMFVPYLNDLFERCDRGNGIWSFLELIYPHYQVGDKNIDVEKEFHMPKSILYSFIHDHYGIPEISVDVDEVPELHALIIEELRYVLDTGEVQSTDLLHKEYVSQFDSSLEGEGYDPDAEFEVYTETSTELVGYVYEFNWSIIRRRKNEKLIEFIENEDNPFMKEYNAMRRLFDILQAKVSNNNTGSKLKRIL